MGDELFPEKDGKMLTTDIDYVDVWKVMLTANAKHSAYNVKTLLMMSVLPSLLGNGSSESHRKGEKYWCV